MAVWDFCSKDSSSIVFQEIQLVILKLFIIFKIKMSTCDWLELRILKIYTILKKSVVLSYKHSY